MIIEHRNSDADTSPDSGPVKSGGSLADFAPGRILHAEITGCDDLWQEMDASQREQWIEEERNIVDRVFRLVNEMAEANMLKTHKLEGAHFAAMRKFISLYPANAKLSGTASQDGGNNG